MEKSRPLVKGQQSFECPFRGNIGGLELTPSRRSNQRGRLLTLVANLLVKLYVEHRKCNHSSGSVRESHNKYVIPKFVFGTILYMFVSDVLIKHDLGVWNRAFLNGRDDWSALNQSEHAVDNSRLFFTLRRRVGLENSTEI